MGAWGTDSFSNDEALDFLNDLVEADDDTPLFEALATVAEADSADYLGVTVSGAAIAAAEVIAALAGAPPSNTPEELKSWINLQPQDVANELIDAHSEYANAIVERVKTSSELAELWARSEYYDAWHEEIDDLRWRLASSKRK